MRLFKKLRRKIDYLSQAEIDLIHQAYQIALEAHRGQKRRTGEEYISHPVAVACILADMKMDYQTIMAALLHDVIEDTPVQKETLQEKFGKIVADLVDGVSKLTQIEFVSRAEAQAENFRKMVLAMAKDIRVILVKLADRLHNMRTLGSLAPAKRRRIAKETLEIFAPIANRLGMRETAVELEELGFQAHYPRRYSILKEAIENARGNRKKILNLIHKTIDDALVHSNLPSCVVIGREKHLYSIYRKMRNKHVPFNEVMDVYAFRIIVDDVDACYRVLGVVHNLFKPVPERFKDYIAIPKANGYQSLHTTLFGPYGLPIEIQIRTTDMDRIATSGIAAHWLYKTADQESAEPQVRAQKWVRNLIELQQKAGSSLEFIESVKVDLFPDEVYVFTPKGDIKQLPSNTTALDYAYAVHTDLGNHSIGVKIDRQQAPLSTILTNGQTVEIITSAEGRPNPAWLDFVVTSKARSAIRHFLKNQRKGESVALGKDLLEKVMGSYSLSLSQVPQSLLNLVLDETHNSSLEDLFEEIGLGNRASLLVAQRLSDLITNSSKIGFQKTEPSPPLPLVIKGAEGMAIKFASCCYPIPGDPIIGILVPGEGLIVHSEKCSQITGLQRRSEYCMLLRWDEQAKGEFAVVVTAEIANQRGVLALIAAAISQADSNIEDINVMDRDGQYYLVDFKILVHDRHHLDQVTRNIRKIPQVLKVTRGREGEES